MNNTVNGLKKGSHVEEPIDPDNLCGIGTFKPRWLQKFATKNAYLVSYCSLSLCQGIFYTYMVSVLTTIEKRFAVSSKVSGIIMTGNEFSQIFGAIFVGFYGGAGHRPRWIAVGMYVSALSCFLMTLPEFLVPDNDDILQESMAKKSSVDLCWANSTEEKWCQERKASSSSIIAMVMLFLGLFVSGLGTLALHSLGFPYMDDNTSKKKVPLVMGISFGLRIIGPALGFLLGGSVLQFYHDLSKQPDITPEDPRWVGAWWLGFFIIGTLIIVTSSFMLLFPRELPRTKMHANALNINTIPVKTGASKEFPPLKELPVALKRLVKNPIIMAHTVEATFYLLGVIGFSTFFPKYVESQFRQTATRANIIAATAGIGVMMIGYILSGAVIQYFRFRPRVLAAYAFFTQVIYMTSLVAGMFLTCQENVPVQGTLAPNGLLDLSQSCNTDCACTTTRYSPVCDLSTNQTYFSACHLGCTTYNETAKTFSNCLCSMDEPFEAPHVNRGKCSIICQAFMYYVIIKTITRFIGSTDRVGTTIIMFRAIEPRDKGITMAWFNAILCLFAFMPCTILYGAIIDKTCLVWEESCGKRGNCWVYDPVMMRFWLHGFTLALLVLASLCQLFIWYKCKHLKLYEEPEATEDKPSTPDELPLSEIPPKA